MSNRKVLLTESSLEDIADAIREKTGSSDTYTPAAMAAGIRSIEGGATPSESLAGNLAVAYRDLTFPVGAGTHCVYDGSYYIAATEIEYAEAFNAAHWTRITAGEEIEGLAEAVEGKQPIEPGMGLSSNDYTDADKAMLEEIAAALSGAQLRRRYAGAFICAKDTIAGKPDVFTLFGRCVQDGTPAPDAPVAIDIAGSGGSIGVSVTGKNILPMHAVGTETSRGFTAIYNPDGSILLNGTRSDGGSGFAKPFVIGSILLPAGRYVFSGTDRLGNSTVTLQLYNNTAVAQIANLDNVTKRATFRLSTPSPVVVYVGLRAGATISNGVMYPMLQPASDGDETYAPYTGSVAAIPVPGGLPGIPVAEGGNYIDANGQRWLCDTIDRGSGQHVRRCGIIDSYDGEALPGPWLSSKDVYAEGSSPTTGAKVVYALEWPVATDLTDAQLAALDALRAHDGTTALFTDDPVQPEMAAAVFVQLPEYTA